MSKKIKVAFDYQIFIRQCFGGISKSLFETCSRLEKNSNFELEYPVLFSQNYYFREKVKTLSITKKSKLITYLLRLINKIYFIVYLIRNKDCNIVHATYYSSYFYHWLPTKTKYVLTVHDCTQELCSQDNIGNKRMRILKKKAIYRADAIIVPSENTKSDVLKLYNVNKEKIHIVNWGVGENKNDINNIKEKLPKRYILFVGMRNDYKNFNVLLVAMQNVCLNDESIKIVCVGGGKFTKNEIKAIENMHLENNIMQYRLNDTELEYVYQNARCFVYPSYYEGFGIPILEAFANNCPVILSKASCFPEIGGEAALYFQPDKSEQLEEIIIKVVNDEILRKELIIKGRERVKLFTWEKTVKNITEVYKEVLEG